MLDTSSQMRIFPRFSSLAFYLNFKRKSNTLQFGHQQKQGKSFLIKNRKYDI